MCPLLSSTTGHAAGVALASSRAMLHGPAKDASATAMRLATRYAQSHALHWGKPEKAITQGIQRDASSRRPEVDDTTWVFFRTPKAEEDRLWKRILIVKRDGTVLNLRDGGNPDAFSPHKVRQLALQYASDQKLGWDEVEWEVERKDADTALVYFKTPTQEEQTLSKRVLIVGRDGSVSGQRRR
jgi:hypothetical protein